MKVSIIIVNYNGKELLKRCLKSLSNITYSSHEIIVVDNNSSDDSVSWLRRNYPKISIVVLHKNEGFAQANNIGVTYAKGQYLLFLNNDTEVTQGFLEPLVLCLDSYPSVGGVQSKILLLGDKRRHDSVGAYFTKTGFLYHFGYSQLDSERYNKEFYLYTAKGACMLFRKNVIEQVGLFDKSFFAYFEETDFCHRVWLAGYTVKYQPDSIIYHEMGATSNRMDNSNIQYHSFKNRICSYIKNLEISNLFKILPTHLCLCLLASGAYLVRSKVSLGIAILRAIYWNVKHIRETIDKRKQIQVRIRRVKDADFLPLVQKNPPLKYYFYLFLFSLRGYKE